MASIRMSIQVIPDNQDEEIMEKALWVKLPLEPYRPISRELAIRNTVDIICDTLKEGLFADLIEKTNDVLKKEEITRVEYCEGITTDEYLDLKAKIIRGLPNG